MDRWIAITAGFSPKEIQKAASRVRNHSQKLHLFNSHLIIGPNNLTEYAPKTSSIYKKWMNSECFGHGYYSWKAEIVHNVISGHHGACDGIVWIDAGCEIFSAPWTRYIFKQQLKKSAESGYQVFELDTPEAKYTKYAVRKYFGKDFLRDSSPQVQATHFFLHGDVGRKVAKTWFEASLEGINFLDLSTCEEDGKDFVLHKSDQSLFSMSIKSLKLNERMKAPPAGNRGALSRYAAMRSPVWASRNRTGETLKSGIQIKIEDLVLPELYLN